VELYLKGTTELPGETPVPVPPQVPIPQEAGWAQCSSGRFPEEKNILPLPGMEPQFLVRHNGSLVTIRPTAVLHISILEALFSKSQSCQRISDVPSSYTMKANSQTVVYLQICQFFSISNPYLHTIYHISLINDKGHFHNSCLDGIRLGLQ
jgi:hypothetical protein